ncbi:MAG: hypothetical protein CMQ54_05640 [Gammaproteobacteria bacterium]|nr:hypothetical protein [Gammaproteobacteria bacterium]
MLEYHFINHPNKIIQNISGYNEIGLDTEFMREKTFFPQLCLVQISTRDNIFCIDPFTKDDQTKFWKELLSKNWIVHSARQDIEVIFQTTGIMPNTIFDTQIAAEIIGMQVQIGYANLIKELFGINITKSHTRSDWAQRPLKKEFLDYAAEDVMYLLPIANILSEKLDKKGRLDWAHQDSALLLNPNLYKLTYKSAIDRIKGARKFFGVKREVAIQLASWREKEAILRNRPRQWIISDKNLLDIADRLPVSRKQLSEIKGLPSKFIANFDIHIINNIEKKNELNKIHKPPQPINEDQKELLKKMYKIVSECAKDHGLATETLASKRELSLIITKGGAGAKIINGWRRHLIGEQLLKLVQA